MKSFPEESRRSFRFRRKERLKKRSAIREVFKKGRRVTCFGAKLFVLKNDLSYNRIGFTFCHKFGNAADRNRARRLGREAYRYMGYALAIGYDMVLLLYPGEDTFSARMEQLRLLFSKAGLLYGNTV
ncbi:MAG: ribonuclease P protein component [Treponema sp.]|nr:ribonuclease P protein component [Treponema sp.]